MIKSLFKSQDSKYFLKTAFKVSSVPLTMTLLLAYSLWLYVEINYSFFLANGFADGPEMKEAFWDNLLISQIDYLPLLGLFFVIVFFLGLFLAHLLLRPFNYIRDMCEDILVGEAIEEEKGFLDAKKLVIKASFVFVEYIGKQGKKEEVEEFGFPEDLEKIQRPKPDGVFYLQFVLLLFILAISTSIASYFTLFHLHQSMVRAAMEILQPSTSLNLFLSSQQSHLETIFFLVIALTLFLYTFMARGIIREIEGVSYSYLRDIREITGGDHRRRLHPRTQDPGQEAAYAINQVMNICFPVRKK